MKLEYCCQCAEATGRAGAVEDSLYTETGGPFCEGCFPPYKLVQLEQDAALTQPRPIENLNVKDFEELKISAAQAWAICNSVAEALGDDLDHNAGSAISVLQLKAKLAVLESAKLCAMTTRIKESVASKTVILPNDLSWEDSCSFISIYAGELHLVKLPNPSLSVPLEDDDDDETNLGQDRREAWAIASKGDQYNDFGALHIEAKHLAYDYFIDGWKMAIAQYKNSAPDVINQLRIDLDNMKVECNKWMRSSVADHLNADRYLWLRKDVAISAVPRVWRSNESAEPTKCLDGSKMDNEIDQAMKGNV